MCRASTDAVLRHLVVAPFVFIFYDKNTGEVCLEINEMNDLEMILENWRLYERYYNGKDEKTREREKRAKAVRSKVMSATGGEPDGKPAGLDDLRQLSVGILEKKKEGKPACGPGNPYHDKDGRFTKAEKEPGSYSSGYWNSKGSADCHRGKYKRSQANRRTQITKKPCGRLEKNNPNKKARHRCKDGKALWETIDDDHIKVHRDGLTDFLIDELRTIVETLIDDEPIDEGNNDRCPPGCQTYDSFLNAIDRLERSRKGELRGKA